MPVSTRFTPKAALRLCYFFNLRVLAALLRMDGDCVLDSSEAGSAVKRAGLKAVDDTLARLRFYKTIAVPLYKTLSGSTLAARACFLAFFLSVLGYSMRDCKIEAW